MKKIKSYKFYRDCITCIFNHTVIKYKKLINHDILARELILIHKCETRIFPYLLTLNYVLR